MSSNSTDYNQKYYQRNKERIKEKSKQYQQSHKKYCKEYQIKYQKKNKELRRQKVNDYHNHRLKTNLNYKIKCYLRSRLYKAIKNGYKSGSAVKDLGCSIELFRKYLETKFQDGMAWNNYGEWHIDHIKPLSHFDLSDRKQLLEACNYTNLQPLWSIDNLLKSNKVTGS